MVVVKDNDLPANRCIDDVTAVILDEDLDELIKRKAAPGLFRMAVEAAAHQRYFDDQARSGAAYLPAAPAREFVSRSRYFARGRSECARRHPHVPDDAARDTGRRRHFGSG